MTDEHNKRTAVVIELKTIVKYEEEIEDLLDCIIAEARKDEDKIPLDKVIKNLKKSGKLK